MKNSLSVMLVLMLAGCASTPHKTNIKEMLQGRNIVVLPVESPIKLTMTTKSQALGNMVVASVAGSVLGGGVNISAGDPKAMNGIGSQAGNIGQQFTRELHKALPVDYSIKLGSGVDLALAKSLSDMLAHPDSPVSSNDIFLSVNGVYWNLSYVSLFSSDYVLKYSLSINLKEKTVDGYKLVTPYGCVGEVTEKHNYDAWVANDYALVNEAANAIVKKCTEQYVAFATK